MRNIFLRICVMLVEMFLKIPPPPQIKKIIIKTLWWFGFFFINPMGQKRGHLVDFESLPKYFEKKIEKKKFLKVLYRPFCRSVTIHIIVFPRTNMSHFHLFQHDTWLPNIFLCPSVENINNPQYGRRFEIHLDIWSICPLKILLNQSSCPFNWRHVVSGTK